MRLLLIFSVITAAFIYGASLLSEAACPEYIGPVHVSQVESAQNFPSLGFFVIRIKSPWYAPKTHKIMHTNYSEAVGAITAWGEYQRCKLSSPRREQTSIAANGPAPAPLVSLTPKLEVYSQVLRPRR